MARKTNRRNFLKGKSAAHALADMAQEALPPELAMAMLEDSYLLRISRRAMACQFEISLNAGQYPEGMEASVAALDVVQRLESELSYFRPESCTSRINREAAFRPVEVTPEMMEILVLAQGLAGATGGAYDITSTALWETWGFARRWGKIPDDRQLDEARRLVGSHLLELDRERLRVRLLEPGVRISLGSLGKGYALDRAAGSLWEAGIEHFLIHAGSSSVIGRGSRGTTAAVRPGPGWGVGLPSPLRPDRRLAMVRLVDRALGTSGSQAQSFWHNGKRYGHILDPRTGRPADELVSATAIAPTAMMADALSTAFYVMGADATLDYCRAHPDCGAVVFLRARCASGLEMRTAGLGENDLLSAE